MAAWDDLIGIDIVGDWTLRDMKLIRVHQILFAVVVIHWEDFLKTSTYTFYIV